MELVGEPAGVAPGALPWTLLRDTDPETRPELFERENFVSVTAETALDQTDPAAFLDAATRFVNTRLFGTLAATVVVHPAQRKDPAVGTALARATSHLRYGVVCINHFPGIAFVLMGIPWCGHPTSSLTEPESGIGFAHDPYMLGPLAEEAVFEGPWRISPKPMWFPTHRNGVGVARALRPLYSRPSARRLPRLLGNALRA